MTAPTRKLDERPLRWRERECRACGAVFKHYPEMAGSIGLVGNVVCSDACHEKLIAARLEEGRKQR